ncbi:PaaI family thioesterase [Roseateles violae]|uniref:PaaI family thioesterase n=1 Tax=Roseateles violae TaxID=3058042 RepID=A0ABT8DZ71_9BURK|nr:PaaI family thioesterase [Pelomonas sp. PFR6]MDN3922883.1 PaaI family thioesterase [Pelomonas sp. PFR6]
MDADLDSLRRFFASAPFMVELGVRPMAVEPGRVRTELTLERKHLQHTGVAHAGVLASLADHSMGAAAQTLAPEGHWILTAEFKTNLLRGSRGDKLVCEAWVLKPGRQIMFTEAEVHAISGEGDEQQRQLVVKASGTMAVTQAK